MRSLLTEMTHWHWWTLAIVLMVFEVFAPGAIFLWIGLSAVIVGIFILFASEMSWESQILIFAVFSVLSIIIWRAWRKRHPRISDHPTLNRRSEQYIGRIFTLDTPIIDGVGRIHVDHTIWKIHGPNCPAGTTVKVTGVDGVLLLVEKE